MENQKDIQTLPWQFVGIIILSLRFAQGWIFWGGGSRRFIYDPSKLDPHSHAWMANKLQSAMPGALFGIDHAISFLLQHFTLLYTSIILFSLAELLSGLALLLGFFTRLAAFITVLISVALMTIFGWQGTTCMDEWTMATSNFAMGLTLVLAGSSIYSIDNWLLRRRPSLMQRKWFVILASGPWSFKRLKTVGLLFLFFTVFFTLTTYNYYRGAIFSRYHAGPVSAYQYHVSLTQGKLNSDGSLMFNMYVDAGESAVPIYIIKIALKDAEGKIVENWVSDQLDNSSEINISNTYAFNQIKLGPYGIIAPVSARATIKLPANRPSLTRGHYIASIYSISGQEWRFDVNN